MNLSESDLVRLRNLVHTAWDELLPSPPFARTGDDIEGPWTYTFRGQPVRWTLVVAESMRTDTAGVRDLLAYGAFRTRVVDGIMEWCRDRVGCESCHFTAVGSVTMTSDYDVTVTGPLGAELVALFNLVMRTVFGGQESVVTLDTNLYGASAIAPLVGEPDPAASGSRPGSTLPSSPYRTGVSRKDGTTFQYVVMEEPESDEDRSILATDASNQRAFAFLKLFFYCEPSQLTEALQLLQDQGTTIPALLLNDVTNGQCLFRVMGAWRDASVADRNRAYERELVRVRQAQVRMEDDPGDPAKRTKYRDAISRAAVMAQETLFTVGALLHVVGVYQAEVPIPLSKDGLVDSFLENVGEVFRELHGAREASEAVLLHSSKYMLRAFDALQRITPTKRRRSSLNAASELAKLRGRRLCDSPVDGQGCTSHAQVHDRIHDLLTASHLRPDRIQEDLVKFIAGMLVSLYVSGDDRTIKRDPVKHESCVR